MTDDTTPPPKVNAHRGSGAGDGDENTRVSDATQIVQMAQLVGAELFHTVAGAPYVTVPVGDHRETYGLRARTCLAWLSQIVYATTSRCPSSTALAAATNTLAGIAVFDGPVRRVDVRIAEDEGALWLDLGDPAWRVVRITPEGWDVRAGGSARFRRPPGMLALPVPTRGGSLLDLRPFVNVADEDFLLVCAWEIAALRPTGPYPVLVLTGEAGAAKSSTARAVRRTIDPHESDLRRPPRNTADLMIDAVNNRVVALENVSSLPTWLSDDLAALATGGGLSKRALYTDSEECVLGAQRPILLNGIGRIVTRADLLDRSLLLTLPAIQDEDRQAESEFWAAFRQAHPAILGALLDAVVMALRNHAGVHLPRKPRMADFAVWMVAAEPACPWSAGTFLSAYAGYTQDAIEALLDGDPVGDVVRTLAPWTGTATDLLAEVTRQAPEHVTKRPDWFSVPQQVSDALRRLIPALRKTGIAVTFSKESHTRRRLITLALIDDAAAVGIAGIAGIAAPDAASPDSTNDSGPGDRGDRRDRISLVRREEG